MRSAERDDVPSRVRFSARRRVLIVDGDPKVRELFAGYLDRKGFHAVAVDSGQGALRQFPEFRPHMVLLDIAMAGTSGVEALRRIRALPLSGTEDAETFRRALALGPSGFPLTEGTAAATPDLPVASV